MEGEKTPTYADDMNEPTPSSLEDLVKRAATWHGVEGEYIVVDEHIVQGVIQHGDSIYVIRHSSVIAQRSWGGGKDIFSQGNSDKISLEALPLIPDSYWDSLGIEKLNLLP